MYSYTDFLGTPIRNSSIRQHIKCKLMPSFVLSLICIFTSNLTMTTQIQDSPGPVNFYYAIVKIRGQTK